MYRRPGSLHYRPVPDPLGHDHRRPAGRQTRPAGLCEAFQTQGSSMLQHDHDIAQVLVSLKEQGLEDNTIVWYSTDNGPCRGRRRAVSGAARYRRRWLADSPLGAGRKSMDQPTASTSATFFLPLWGGAPLPAIGSTDADHKPLAT
nr:sulfatase-like hydrolase/transferase [Pseudomonas fluorescens]